MNNQSIILRSIGTIYSSRKEVKDDYWGDVLSEIQFDPNQLEESALWGLENFSHVEVLFYMNLVELDKIERGARHPRGNTLWPKIGILSQRGKNRPNQLGISRAEIIEVKKYYLKVKGLDAVDGTPVLDIKPYMKQFGPRGEVKQPVWCDEIMKNYF